MAQHYGALPIVTDGLVLLLDAGDKTSYPGTGSTWYDLTGKSADGAITSATYNSNGYFDFDGVNDHIDVASINGGTSIFRDGNWTLSIWGYRNGGSEATNSIHGNVFNALGHSPRMFWAQGSYGTALAGKVSTVYQTLMGSGGTFLDAWHYVQWTSDQTNYRLYVDGSAENSANYQQTDDEYAYMIGASPWGTERFYGKIGSVEIYNKALSPSEISQNFEAKRKRFGV